MNYTFDLTEEEAQAALAAARPSGYRILVALPKVQEKDGSVWLPQARVDDEAEASIMGQVLAFGEVCYADKAKFPSGPWCDLGDVVLMGSYAGRRFKINDREYRLINDDTVQAVIRDPSKISRAV